MSGPIPGYPPDASASVRGLVNLTGQVFAGLKEFQDGARFDTFADLASDPSAPISASGHVRLRSNAGVLEASQDGSAYAALGGITGSGSSGRITVWSGSATVTSDANLTWNSGSHFLGINSPTAPGGYTAALVVDGGDIILQNGWSIDAIGGAGISAGAFQVLDNTDTPRGTWGLSTLNQVYWTSQVTDSLGAGAFRLISNTALLNADLLHVENGTGVVKWKLGITDLTFPDGTTQSTAFTGSAGITQLTGDVTAGPGSGSVAATVASVGGSTAAAVHTSQLLTAAATALSTVSTLALRDASGNAQFNNAVQGYTTTATAGTTTTLTVASTQLQFLTGSTTQTVKLPSASTLATGVSYTVVNLSSGVVTVQDNSAGALCTIQGSANSAVTFTCTNIGSAAGTWSISAAEGMDSSGNVSLGGSTLSFRNTSGNTLKSYTANSGSNVAWTLDTNVSMTTSTKIYQLKNAGTVRAEMNLAEWAVYGVANTGDSFTRSQFAAVENVTAYNASPETGYSFYTLWNATDILHLGAVQMGKSNASINNGDSFMRFVTRSNSPNQFNEVMRLTPTANVLIGSASETSNTERLQVTGSGIVTTSLKVGTTLTVGKTASLGAQGTAWIEKSTSGGLGADVWIVNSASIAVGATARLSFGSDGTTDATPNGVIDSIVTNASTFTADFVYKLYDGSALNEKWRMVANAAGDFYGQEGAKFGLNGSGLTSYIQGDSTSHGLNLFSNVTMGANTNAGYIFDTTTTATGTQTTRHTSWKNHGTEIARLSPVEANGSPLFLVNLSADIGSHAAIQAPGFETNGSYFGNTFESRSSSTITSLLSNKSSGANNIALLFKDKNTMSDPSMKLISYSNASTEIAWMDYQGYTNMTKAHPIASGKRQAQMTIVQVTDTTYTVTNFPALTYAGTQTAAPAQDSARMMLNNTTGSVSGNVSGVTGPYTVTRFDYRPKFGMIIRTPATITNTRIIVGLADADVSGNANVAAYNGNRIVAFLYDSAIGGNWLALSSDGTTASTNDTGTAVAANTTYTLSLEFYTSGTCLYRINNGTNPAIQKTANLPTGTTNIGPQCSITTLTSSANSLYSGTGYLEHN